MVSGSDLGLMIENALKGILMAAATAIVIAIILTSIITTAIVKSLIKTPEEIRQEEDKQQVIDQLTPHQKEVLGL